MTKKQKKKLQKAIISFAIAIIAIYFGIDETSNNQVQSNMRETEYKVQRVVDGDTLIIEINNVEERVRLIGVDTPESVHPDAKKNVSYGKVASEYTKELVEGKYVGLELDVQERDRYGRLLAYVYINGEMLNERLLMEGHATIATYPPNVKYVEIFKELEQKAKEEEKGMWGFK